MRTVREEDTVFWQIAQRNGKWLYVFMCSEEEMEYTEGRFGHSHQKGCVKRVNECVGSSLRTNLMKKWPEGD